MKSPFILITGGIILVFILGTKAFWSILVLTVSIYLLIFISNYLKKFETGDKDQTSEDFWKYSYDIRKFKNQFGNPKNLQKLQIKKFLRID
jgi:hypothetical protein